MRNTNYIFTKIILLSIFVTFSYTTYGQADDFNALLDSGKAFFERERTLNQEQLDAIDFGKLTNDLEKATQLKPGNTEAKYFLGYMYSRVNSRDGRSMVSMNLDLTLKCSQQFENIIKLTPKYTGEIIILDPYSKISSEWGSLAMGYWHNNKIDSAKWAFSQGKLRGGFGDFILNLNRKILDGCSKNSILISSGDNFTIPLWYLQIAEGYRADVSVIDISLLNTNWYPAYLSKNNIVSFNLPNPTLDTIEYCKWKDKKITINNFSWIVKPSYYDQYLLRGDRVFLSLLQQNKFKRDIYFTTAFAEESRLSLKDHLEHLIVVDKLITSPKPEQAFETYKKSISVILELSKYINLNSPDELNYFDYCRYDLFAKTNDYIEKKDYVKAKDLIRVLDTFADEQKFPYHDENGKKYATYLRERL